MSSVEHKRDFSKCLVGHCCVYGDENQWENFDRMELWWNLVGENYEVVEKVAKVMVVRVPSAFKKENLQDCPRGYNMFTAMEDGENADMCTVAAELGFMPWYYEKQIMPWAPIKELKASDLYYIESVCVRPEYRNSGIGTEILRRIKPMVSRFFREKNPFLVLFASPVEMEPSDPGFEEAKVRLRNWYLRNGFMHANERAETLVYRR